MKQFSDQLMHMFITRTMEWLSSLFIEQSVIQAVVLLSVIIALGLLLGKIKILGVSLGVTFVFFLGILAGHFGLSINNDILNFAESFGLIIFVYTLGLQVGPGFFASFRKGGMQLNLLASAVVFIGTALTILLHFITGISLPEMIGILCGAVTNTPALGAAQQTLKQLQLENPLIERIDLALGCAVTYPLGVIGVIMALASIRKLFAPRITPEFHGADSTKTYIGAFQVYNPAIFGKTIKEVAGFIPNKFIVSRLWRDGRVNIPNSETVLNEKDRLLVIAVQGDVKALTALFGEQEHADWNKEDIDWNTIDSQLVSQRILVTRSEINGKKIEQLRLRNRYGINITRVYRAGMQLLATPSLTLQIGDRLTVVGEQSSIKNVESELGNAVKRLKEPNLIGIFIGVLMGLILGSIPFAVPGISLPVKLGIAGGPIVAGILMGSFGPRFHLVTYTTQSAGLMLRGLGISLYLACLGLDAGAHFFEIVFGGQGLLWIGLGFILTFFPVVLVGFIALKIMKCDYATVSGMLSGSMNNPMALNYANASIEGDEPSVAYATVYPLTMFLRVIIAQLILMIFL